MLGTLRLISYLQNWLSSGTLMLRDVLYGDKVFLSPKRCLSWSDRDLRRPDSPPAAAIHVAPMSCRLLEVMCYH